MPWMMVQSKLPVVPQKFISEVRESIRESLAAGYPVIGRTAQKLGISTRTFQRRLQEARASYGQLVEEVRLDEARRLLQNTDLKVSVIASRLGYADPSSCTRFLVQRIGSSPRSFRREKQRY
jgi:AraC-like DNA-binding protein